MLNFVFGMMVGGTAATLVLLFFMGAGGVRLCKRDRSSPD